jgi:hypothetical protein
MVKLPNYQQQQQFLIIQLSVTATGSSIKGIRTTTGLSNWFLQVWGLRAMSVYYLELGIYLCFVSCFLGFSTPGCG